MKGRWIHVALTSVALMWGGVFIANSKLLAKMDALQVVTIRFSLISLAFVAIFAASPTLRPRLSRKQTGALLVAGALAIPGAQLPIVEGQNYLSPTLVAVFVTLTPIWAAVISAVWLKERFKPLQVVGFLVAFGGSVIVILTGTGDGDLTVDNPWGAALTMLTPICWAAYTVMSKPLTTQVPPMTAVGVSVIAGTLVMFPLYPHAVSAIDDIGVSGWLWLLYLMFAGTILTYWIWFKALAVMPASKTSAYMYGVPLAALLWSWVVLDNVPSGIALIGGAVMIIGVVMTQWTGALQQAQAASAKRASTTP